jgi:hypothetical protein
MRYRWESKQKEHRNTQKNRAEGTFTFSVVLEKKESSSRGSFDGVTGGVFLAKYLRASLPVVKSVQEQEQ